MRCIADVVREKVANIVQNKNFMALLSDGSQARKTKNEKELTLVRVERNGKPTYFVASLINMEDYGGVDAVSLKSALDSVFGATGNIPLEDYETKLVTATADGANVNLGIYSGALTRLKEQRPWLITFHCVNHRLELGIKDAVAQVPKFREIDSFYTTLFYLFKNSGKLKSECQQAASALDVTFYPLPKIQGTRFVNHRRRGFKKLLHNWPALLTSFTNTLAYGRNCRGETRAKLEGILKKLKSYKFLCQVAAYLDVLDAISPLSLVFESDLLMAYEVPPAVEKTINQLEDLIEEDLDEAIDSNLKMFQVIDEDGLVTLRSTYARAGHERKKPNNREYHDIELDNVSYISEEAMQNALSLRAEGINVLMPFINTRFKSFTENEVFKLLNWIDPQYWQLDKRYGFEEIRKLSEIFESPLQACEFDKGKAITEWRSLRVTVKSFYANLDVRAVWEKFFTFKKQEYPNILMLVELIMCFSSSNSAVERVFCTLTTILSDRRLSMSHSTMEDCVMIKGNSRNWNDDETEEILRKATDKYLETRRTLVFSKENSRQAEQLVNVDSDAELSSGESDDVADDDVADDNSSVDDNIFINGDSDNDTSEDDDHVNEICSDFSL